jgi:hypothetical protein
MDGDSRAEPLDVPAIEGTEDDRVRIPHIGDRESGELPFNLDLTLFADTNGAHVDGDLALTSCIVDCARPDAGSGLDTNDSATKASRAGHVHRNASDTVSTHLWDGTIGVDDDHSRIRSRLVWREHQEDPVAPYTEVAIA